MVVKKKVFDFNDLGAIFQNNDLGAIFQNNDLGAIFQNNDLGAGGVNRSHFFDRFSKNP